MEDEKLKEQLGEYFRLSDIIIPRWQHEILAYIANKHRYIHIARGCGNSITYFYEDLLNCLFLQRMAKNKEKRNDT